MGEQDRQREQRESRGNQAEPGGRHHFQHLPAEEAAGSNAEITAAQARASRLRILNRRGC
jgi:hypothetical protein